MNGISINTTPKRFNFKFTRPSGQSTERLTEVVDPLDFSDIWLSSTDELEDGEI